MYCNQCGNRNPRGSRFCRHCGVALSMPGAARPIPDEEYAVRPGEGARLQSQIQALLDSAFVFSEKGDVVGAIHACQQALLVDPTSATAHSFLALLFERSGQIGRAIEEYQHAVRLNPDSALDRDSLERLQRKSLPPETPAIPHGPRAASPYFDATPVVVAATFAIVLLLGTHHYVNGRTLQEEERKRVLARVADTSRPPAPVERVEQFRPLNRPLNLAQATNPALNLNQLTPPPAAPGSPVAVPIPNSSSPPVTGAAGAPAGNPLSPSPNPRPGRWVDVPLPGSRTPVPSSQPNFAAAPRNNIGRINPADSVPAQPRPGSGAEGATEPRSNPGQISVTVSKAPDGRRGDGGTSSPGAGDSARGSSLERVANQLFLKGDLEGAIDNYRRALEMTSADVSGPLHQQLAGAYLRKKMTSEAVSEYRKALEAFRQQKNAGIQVAMAERGLRACQDAINTWEPFLR